MRWTQRVLVGLAVALATGVSWAQDRADERVRYDGDKAVRVAPRTTRELRTVLGLSRTVLSERVGIGRAPIEVVVTDEALRALRALGLEVEILVEDVQAAIDAERAEIERRNAMRDITWYENYHTLDEITAYVGQLAADHPAMATTEVIGASLEGRDMVALRVTGPGDPSARVQVVYNACQHAREWVSPPTVIYAAEQLLTSYGDDTRVTDLMDRVEFVFVPVVNPDGYRYTWTNNRLWRKNRRNNGGGVYGVDLNRNWGYMWGGDGSSGDPGSDIYRGTAPFSEPETSVLSGYVLGLPRAAAHIDFHSYSQLILRPWGYTDQDPPEPDNSMFIALGQAMSDAIEAVHGRYYRSQRGIDLYVTSGSMNDWGYSEGLWSYTIELRPEEGSSYQFELPPGQILPTCEENFPAILELTEFVAYPVRFDFPNGTARHVESGEPTELRVEILASTGEIDPASATLHTRSGPSGIFVASPLTHLGGSSYSGLLPGADCADTIEWYVEAQTFGGQGGTWPAAGADGPAVSLALDLLASVLDDAETDAGWTVGAPDDDASTGVWGRMDPERTDAQPEDDHTAAPGINCWITDGRAGSGIGSYDVDGGTTTLTSPVYDATGGIDGPVAVLGYWRWYSNNKGAAPNEDSMPVEVSFDGGSSWNLLENVTDNADAWSYREFVLNEIAEPTGSVRVRFKARDLGSGSIVEAGVDDLQLRVYGCAFRPGDYNQDGTVDTRDVLDFLNDWAARDPKADWNGDGLIDTRDVLDFLNDWSQG